MKTEPPIVRYDARTNTLREVNSLGEKPRIENYTNWQDDQVSQIHIQEDEKGFLEAHQKWQEAESKLRTFQLSERKKVWVGDAILILENEIERLKSTPNEERYVANRPDFIGAEINRVKEAIELINKLSPQERSFQLFKEKKGWEVGDKFTSPETGDQIFTVKKVGEYYVDANDSRSRSGETSFAKSYISKIEPQEHPSQISEEEIEKLALKNFPVNLIHLDSGIDFDNYEPLRMAWIHGFKANTKPSIWFTKDEMYVAWNEDASDGRITFNEFIDGIIQSRNPYNNFTDGAEYSLVERDGEFFIGDRKLIEVKSE